MLRRCLLLGLLLTVWGTGCASTPSGTSGRADGQSPAPACGGELLLVEADSPSSTPPPASSLFRIDPDEAARRAAAASSTPIDRARAVASARRFTVAIRGYRNLTDRASDSSGPPTDGVATPAHSNQMLVEGTGVVVDRSGLVLTNSHVIQGADRLESWVEGRGWLPSRLVAQDPQSDLAVLTVDVELATAARWADVAGLDIGQAVTALGYTPGADPDDGPVSLTGRLTGLHRSLQGALDPSQRCYYADLLESTVPLEPGHSGGPLVDRNGALVRSHTASVTYRQRGRRTGYAIAGSRRVREVVASLMTGRPVHHGYLGVLVCTDTQRHRGVAVVRVMADGPAEQAGVRPGDVILRVAHQEVRGAADFAEAVRSGPVGQSTALSLRRAGRRIELTCALGVRP
ncbi:MAG: serine protease [bacterium]|nr:serine protease [bacterium]